MLNRAFWFMGGIFTPASLIPIAWWDNDTPYMAADGSSWTDRISSKVLSISGTSATYTPNAQNGKPSLSFSPTGFLQGTKMAALEGISGITFWSVGKRYAFQQSDNNNSWINMIGQIHYNDDTQYLVTSNGTLKYGSILKSNIFNYSIMVFDGTQTGNSNRLKFWFNGVQQTLSFTGTIPALTETSSLNLKIGAAASLAVTGQSLEHGIVTRAISGQEINLLNLYLSNKYAL